MPKWLKRLDAMAENPKGWTYDEAASVLAGLDFAPPVKPTGSHRWWRHPSGVRVGIPDYGSGTVAVEYIKTMLRILRDAGLYPLKS